MKKISLLLQTTVFKVFIICSLFSFSSGFALAQSKITGKVQDKNTGEVLVGVTVSIKGTTNGTSTDLDGKYELIVSPGTYTLNIRYIMFKELVLENIKVIANEVTYQDILMEETSSDGKELGGATVTAEAKKESMAAINLERKNAVTVSDGVSSEQFRKTPDRNVSDVLKRVSGASIQENKFAIIRGMNDRYNAAYLNGAPLPSTESDRKAFAFNIIPSNLIDNLMMYK